MYLARRPCWRGGVTAVESAIVYPVVLLFTLGLMVGAAGIFRYQQVAALAREGSRWASVRGSQYAQDTGNAAATAQDVLNKVVLPAAVGLDSTKLSCNVTWNPDNTSPDSTVTVTVTYKWVPEAFLAGPITLSSTSTVYMSY
jgi:Flp pilus assembly protein TadG